MIKNSTRMLAGVVVGLVLGGGLAHAAGYMLGWTVLVEVRGLRIRCDDPYIWDSIREIEADDCEIE